MKIGIFGLPLTGKTTVFSLLTNTQYDGSFKTNVEERVAKVIDSRIEKLSKMYDPKKTIFATLNFLDIPSYDTEADKKEKTKIFQMLQTVDALILTVRTFNNGSVPFPMGAQSALKQLEKQETEFIFRDLEVIENRLERLDAQKKKKKITKDEEREEQLIMMIKEHLENEEFASKAELSEEDKKIIGSLSLFTLKPIIVLANLDEDQLQSNTFEYKEELIKKCENQNFGYIQLSGKIESDLVELDADEKEMFMTDYNIDEPGINKLAKAVYSNMGLLSFFTVGKDEVRAWTIKKGFNMKKAAGAIHSDLERGFIKAEMIKYEDLMRLGSEEEVKKAGLWKLAGKEDLVEDGDILHIRANP